MSPELRRARRAVFVAFAVQGLTFATLVTRLATFKDKLDLSDLEILLLLAGTAVLSAMGSVLAGAAASRWGSARTLSAALAGVSLAIMLPAFAEDLGALVATTCVYGVFVGAVDASMNMQGVAVQDRYGRSIMTGFHAMWSFAAVIGAGCAAVAISLDWTLPASFALVTVLGLVVNALTFRDLVSDAVPAETGVDTPDHHVPWWPLLLIAIPTFAMWLTDSATSVWSGIYLQDGLDAAASVAPAAYGAYQALLLLVRLPGDRLVTAYGAARVIRFSGIVGTVALTLIVVAPGLPLVIIGFALLGGSVALVPPLSYVAAAHLDAEGSTTAVARVNVSNYVGYLVAAFAIAFASEIWSERVMFVIPLVAFVAVPLMARRFEPTGSRSRTVDLQTERP